MIRKTKILNLSINQTEEERRELASAVDLILDALLEAGHGDPLTDACITAKQVVYNRAGEVQAVIGKAEDGELYFFQPSPVISWEDLSEDERCV